MKNKFFKSHSRPCNSTPSCELGANPFCLHPLAPGYFSQGGGLPGLSTQASRWPLTQHIQGNKRGNSTACLWQLSLPNLSLACLCLMPRHYWAGKVGVQGSPGRPLDSSNCPHTQ